MEGILDWLREITVGLRSGMVQLDSLLKPSVKELALPAAIFENLSTFGIVMALFCFLTVTYGLPLVLHLWKRWGLKAANFRDEVIPQSVGVVLLVVLLPLLLLDILLAPFPEPERLRFLACILGFGVLGFLDDKFGDKRIKGLRGHFAEALFRRRITTGLVKALGGLAVAGLIASNIGYASVFQTLLAALVIALSANVTNLLDLRPGRACGFFCASSIALLVGVGFMAGHSYTPSLLYLLIPALLIWDKDAQAKLMLGDSGSNLLGAALGLALCEWTVWQIQLVALLLFIALHLLAERYSLTALITKNALLRRLDSWMGER